MELYDWQSRYEIGVEYIDREHKIFINLIEKFANDIKSEQSYERILRTFSEVIHYAQFHFISEENLMQDVDYPAYEGHKRLHQELMGDLHRHFEAFESEQKKLDGVVEFLLEWFVRHTTTEDMNIGNFIADGKTR